MKKYSNNPKGQYGNSYGNLSNEEYISFDGDRNIPLFVHMTGITHPDQNYFVKRKNSAYIVLEYIVEGTGVVEYDGITQSVQKGDVILLLPGKNHTDSANKNDPYKKIWINFQSLTFLNLIFDFSLDSQFVWHADEKLLSSFEALLETAENLQNDSRAHAELSKIIYSILTDLTFVETDSVKITEIARAAYVIINSNIHSNLTINSLAERLSCSKAHLINLFKKTYGITPYQYILNKKLAIAKSLLAKSQLNVCEISTQLSFKDEFHFSNVFKQKTGLTPSQYRTSITQKNPHPKN